MDLGRLIDAAKQLFEGGGVDGLKDAAVDIKDAAEGEGSIVDKVQAGAEAVKDPGEAGPAQ
jgi:hypothetical protein